MSAVQDQRYEERPNDAQDAAHRRPDQPLQADLFQPDFKEDDGEPENQSDGRTEPGMGSERL
jgi:hypothetical protein